MMITRRGMLIGCGCCLAAPGVLAQENVTDMFDGRICAESFGPYRVSGRVTNVGAPSEEAATVLRSILDVAGIRHDIELRAADIERYAKAFATITNGKRYIVYNREDHDWRPGKATLSDVRTMCHEVGHHVASHTAVDEYPAHTRELEADYFAGYALSRLGTRREKVAALFWDWPATQWHPGGLERKKETLAGFDSAEVFKIREGGLPEPRCEPGWQTPEIDVDGKICRVARRCEGKQETTMLACKDYDENWHWVK